MDQVRAVLFDVGETLVDETRQREGWARFLGVPSSWFFAALGAAIQASLDHTHVFDLLGYPHFDVATAREQRIAQDDPDEFDQRNLYPDARPSLGARRRRE